MHPSRGVLTRALTAGAVATIALASLVNAAGTFVEQVDVLHAFVGDASSGYYGWAVAELRDIDGDGITDVLISDPLRTGGGAVYAFSGATGHPLFTVLRPGANLYGYSVADAGDANGDGTTDILVGDRAGAGAAELLSGVDGSLLHRFVAATAGDAMGSAVASAGDVDHDGHPDLLIGARGVTTPLGAGTGRVYIFSGVDYHRIRSIDGPVAGGAFGTGLDLTGDLDGDGQADHVVGARQADPKGNGQVFAVSSATGAILWNFVAPRTGQDLGSFFVAGLQDVTGDGTRTSMPRTTRTGRTARERAARRSCPAPTAACSTSGSALATRRAWALVARPATSMATVSRT